MILIYQIPYILILFSLRLHDINENMKVGIFKYNSSFLKKNSTINFKNHKFSS